MTVPEFDPEAVVDAVSPLLGLTLTAGIARSDHPALANRGEQAELLLAGELVDEDEPAPVFCP